MVLVNVNEFCECQKFLHYNVMTLRTVQDLYTQIPGQMSSWEIEGWSKYWSKEKRMLEWKKKITCGGDSTMRISAIYSLTQNNHLCCHSS